MLSLVLVSILAQTTLFDGGLICGRPNDQGFTIGFRLTQTADVILAVGTQPGLADVHLSTTYAVLPGSYFPTLNGLFPGTRYYYQAATRPGSICSAKRRDWIVTPVHEAVTQRGNGESFTACIVADEHLWPIDPTQQVLYGITLDNILDKGPDLRFSLGDFSGCESYVTWPIANVEEGIYRYFLQRQAMQDVNTCGAFFLALGNHEGEQGWSAIKDVAYQSRLAAIPNPITGGLRQNYYSVEWGDALFIVLDPFTYTQNKPHDNGPGTGTHDGWDWTLGEDQYNWLHGVLATAGATWKFVLIHHLTSTIATGFQAYYGRGGIEIASYAVAGRPSFEWGGEDGDGLCVFNSKRPGWQWGPIHPMLVQYGVNAVFHGHDHFFCWQELDGIAYIECPQPGDQTYGMGWKTGSGYVNGTALPNSGYITLDVSSNDVTVRYRRSWLPGDGVNDEIAFEKTFLGLLFRNSKSAWNRTRP